jgi:hypothetical protein
MKLRRLIPAVVALVALAGCGGSKTFTGSQLSRILPAKADAPRGLSLIAGSSGDQPLDLVARDDTEKSRLERDGFESAFASFYANSGALDLLQNAGKADPSAHLVAALGITFRTAAGAKDALAALHQRDLGHGTHVSTIPVQKIGDESIAEKGTQEGSPLPGYLIYWRDGNAIFGVTAAGGPTAGVTLSEATTVAQASERRAQSA